MSITIKLMPKVYENDLTITSGIYFENKYVGTLWLTDEQLKELKNVIRVGEHVIAGALKINLEPKLKLVKNSDSEDDGA